MISLIICTLKESLLPIVVFYKFMDFAEKVKFLINCEDKISENIEIQNKDFAKNVVMQSIILIKSSQDF